jgi:hypothetical protein
MAGSGRATRATTESLVADHVHAWTPVPGHIGQYQCADCPSTGYRYDSRPIRAHKAPRTFPDLTPVTAGVMTGGHGGAVPRAPRLDETERGAKFGPRGDS